MWALLGKPTKHLIIALDTPAIHLALIEHQKKEFPQIIASQSYIPDTISYSTIIRSLQQFTKHNGCTAQTVSFALRNPFIQEQFLRLATAIALPSDFNHLIDSPMALFDYRYIYTDHEGNSLYYVAQSSLQIQLLLELIAQHTQLTLLHATSWYMALITVYKKVQGAAYRPTQLAVDMLKNNYEIESLITMHMINQLVKKNMSTVSSCVLATLLGTYFQQEEIP